MNYTEIKAAVASYFHRTDVTAATITCIALAEASIARELDLRELETSVDGTTSGSTITLPSDCSQVTKLVIESGGREITLDYISNGDDWSDQTGTPSYFTQLDGALRLYPSPGDAFPYTLHYTAKLTSLSDSVPTNWLSINAADLYVYSSCLEVARWTKDFEEVQHLTQVVAPLMDSIRRYSARAGKPVRSGLQIKVRR